MKEILDFTMRHGYSVLFVWVLAEQLGCPRNRIELLRGHTSRHKTVKIYGLTATDVLAGLKPM